MIDKNVIAGLTPSARRAYAAFMAAGGCVILSIAYIFASILFEEYQLDKRYEREGIHVGGVISSFRYVEVTGKGADRFTGYYPDVSFTTPDGPVTLKASAGTPFSEHQREELVGSQVGVVYLPDQPQRARVIQWTEHFSTSSWVVFLLCTAVSLFSFYCASVIWPRAAASPVSD
ncbi:DUF3592 domain-containing protein [Polaromonas sp. YR568]|uniref:DUF3592 domain-containing protein n=1 Tax=Polaromonas sp. YR568 TaxID=1855301 RepID=UPI000B830E5B|nr:DUF3592 domain-containing protein [Polaromonas sp. YR568]